MLVYTSYCAVKHGNNPICTRFQDLCFDKFPFLPRKFLKEAFNSISNEGPLNVPMLNATEKKSPLVLVMLKFTTTTTTTQMHSHFQILLRGGMRLRKNLGGGLIFSYFIAFLCYNFSKSFEGVHEVPPSSPLCASMITTTKKKLIWWPSQLAQCTQDGINMKNLNPFLPKSCF